MEWLSGGKVIILDPLSGRFIGDLLAENRIESMVASSLSELLAELTCKGVRCLILNDTLRGGRAYEFIPIIKPLRPDLPIIVTAAHNLPDLELRYRLEGVFYYHVQPLGFDDLILAVKSALARGIERKIMVVDDDYDFIDGIRRIVERYGFRVIPAFGSEDALAKAMFSRPDLILIDLMMHGIWDGFRLCWKLKGKSQFRDIPILMMTSMADSPERLSLLTPFSICGEGFIPKPTRADELIREISRFIRR